MYGIYIGCYCFCRCRRCYEMNTHRYFVRYNGCNCLEGKNKRDRTIFVLLTLLFVFLFFFFPHFFRSCFVLFHYFLLFFFISILLPRIIFFGYSLSSLYYHFLRCVECRVCVCVCVSVTFGNAATESLFRNKSKLQEHPSYRVTSKRITFESKNLLTGGNCFLTDNKCKSGLPWMILKNALPFIL